MLAICTQYQSRHLHHGGNPKPWIKAQNVPWLAPMRLLLPPPEPWRARRLGLARGKRLWLSRRAADKDGTWSTKHGGRPWNLWKLIISYYDFSSSAMFNRTPWSSGAPITSSQPRNKNKRATKVSPNRNVGNCEEALRSAGPQKSKNAAFASCFFQVTLFQLPCHSYVTMMLNSLELSLDFSRRFFCTWTHICNMSCHTKIACNSGCSPIHCLVKNRIPGPLLITPNRLGSITWWWMC